MELIKHKIAVSDLISRLKTAGKSIGFVPTMGALHKGHKALLEQARAQNDVLVSSIFVNPTQFDDQHDLNTYPVSPEKDQEILEKAGCDILFLPEKNEMYPDGPVNEPVFNPGYPAEVMEGAFRKGHFDGVITIVHKFFNIVNPHKAYFGQKDYQQYLIIRDMARQLFPKIHVDVVPTVREKSGLALSSRNERLSVEGKKNAAYIYSTLSDVKRMHGIETPRQAEKTALIKLADAGLQTEYFEIRNAENLKPVDHWEDSEKFVACVAARIENIRLIDNVFLP